MSPDRRCIAIARNSRSYGSSMSDDIEEKIFFESKSARVFAESLPIGIAAATIQRVNRESIFNFYSRKASLEHNTTSRSGFIYKQEILLWLPDNRSTTQQKSLKQTFFFSCLALSPSYRLNLLVKAGTLFCLAVTIFDNRCRFSPSEHFFLQNVANFAVACKTSCE